MGETFYKNCHIYFMVLRKKKLYRREKKPPKYVWKVIFQVNQAPKNWSIFQFFMRFTLANCSQFAVNKAKLGVVTKIACINNLEKVSFSSRRSNSFSFCKITLTIDKSAMHQKLKTVPLLHRLFYCNKNV